MTDFYEVLGVPRVASPGEIDNAYRQMARKHHPDHGGDAVAFKRVTAAYRVLSNAESRERYDTTGEATDARQPATKVEQTVAAMVLDAFMQEKSDPIRWMLEFLDKKRTESQKQRDNIVKGRSHLEKRLSDFRSANAETSNEPGRDFIEMALESRIAEADSGIALMENDIKHFSDTMAFLNDLKASNPSGRDLYATFGMGGATGTTSFYWGQA